MKVTLHAEPIRGKSKVRFSVEGIKFRSYVVPSLGVAELSSLLRAYKIDILEHFPEAEFDIKRPNLYSAYVNSLRKIKKVVVAKDVDKRGFVSSVSKVDGFEVNMMEALTGFKGWQFRRVVKLGADRGNLLYTNIPENLWEPLNPLEATCRHGNHSPVPVDGCTCGIYAANDSAEAEKYGSIHGEVYGWGRYVRYELGWRAQFAYPKCFILRPEQIEHIEWLKQYRVPIFINEPTKVYSPEEDGYSLPDVKGMLGVFEGDENANRKANADRSGGTAETAGPGKNFDEDFEDEES